MAQAAPASRDRMLDGIRGYAIVLVLLSHTWTVAPVGDWTAVSWLFSSGDYAVTIFFVVSGFLATRGMLRELERTGRIRPGVLWLRRWIRISAQVYPLVVVVLAVTAASSTMATAYEGTDTDTSAVRILTYTWNGYLREHAAVARPDLGHLWYVCTDLWVIGLILLIVYLVGRWRPVLLVTLAATLLLVMLYRQHVYETEGEFSALIRVQTRADGLLWGALAAVGLPWVQRLRPYALPAMVCSLLALVPLMGLVVDQSEYLGLGGSLLDVAVAVFVLAAATSPPPAYLAQTVGCGPLALAGRYSLVLYIWHYPLFWYVAKAQPDWSWEWQTIVAYAVTLLVGLVAQLVLELPTQRLLRSERWHALDRGIGPALLTVLRQGRDEARARFAEARHPGQREAADDEAADDRPQDAPARPGG